MSKKTSIIIAVVITLIICLGFFVIFCKNAMTNQKISEPPQAIINN